ncbi:hypothetical protein [Sandarakinorhabdus oryzae]|uniref:hypothetical protein n=1 Tax=Sandarakinorhabdus oryzae TaxID=2675220 RepID=UPI0012E18A46|nr:hypothetical protein [Sandarakinorhabdus oryzae]
MGKDLYPDLYFTKEQILLSEEETVLVANDLFSRAPPVSAITLRDRAFIQRCLLIAVDASEKAGMLFDLYSSAVSSVPKQSVKALVKSFAKKVAKRWFKAYLDDTPKYSAAGRAGLQYSQYATDWRSRVSMEDDSFLDNYVIG